MEPDKIEQEFQSKLSTKIRLHSEGHERFRVFTPFRFDDGDHLVIVLKHEANEWILSDNGHTYMHLSYDLDTKTLQSGTRQQLIASALNSFAVRDVNGELRIIVQNGEFGDALYDFVQALLKITDVTYVSRERVQSMFLEDFHQFFEEHVPAERRIFNWRHTQRDPEGIYPVDCRVNSAIRPLFIFALNGDTKTRDATITLHRFEQWELPFRSLSIFESQELINRKVLARFSDVGEKQYSNLTTNKDRIADYLGNILSEPT